MPNTRRLLVVNDDLAIRELLTSMFEERGLPVEELPAVDTLDRADQDVDVVLCVPHPGAPGRESPKGEEFLAEAAAHRMTLHELRERYTEEVLRSTGGNKVQAARILGIDRKTLYRRARREPRALSIVRENAANESEAAHKDGA